MKEFIDALQTPSVLYLFFGILLAISPIIIKWIKWFWGVTKSEVKKEVINDLKQDNDQFKSLMHEQMEVVKDTVEVVKDSIIVMKQDTELSHRQNEQMIEVMMLHIEELSHVKTRVEDHETRIYKIESPRS